MALLVRTFLLKRELQRKRKGEIKNPDISTRSTTTAESTKCRACEGSGEVNVFSAHRGRNLAEDMRQCSGVPVYMNDGLPHWLCGACLELLQSAVEFRRMCRDTAEKLLQLTPRKLVKGNQKHYKKIRLKNKERVEISTDDDDVLLNIKQKEENKRKETEIHSKKGKQKIKAVSTQIILENKSCDLSKEDKIINNKQNVITNTTIETIENQDIKKLKYLGQENNNDYSDKEDNISNESEETTKNGGNIEDKLLEGNKNNETDRPPSPDIDQLIRNEFCRYCGGGFDSRLEYHQHIKACFREVKLRNRGKKARPSQSYLCDTCGKRLSSLRGFQDHKVTHLNIFPYKCDLCPYKSKTRENLKHHRRNHSDERPFVCDLCPKAYKCSSTLSKHRQTHSNGLLQCTMCEMKLPNQLRLKRHVKTEHLGEREAPVSCHICGAHYSTRRHLYRHRIKKHNYRVINPGSGRLPDYLLCQTEQLTTQPPHA